MYPFNAQRLGIQGRVILQFVVAVDGEISDIRIIRKVNDELDQEAIRVVKSMPRWKPGLIENEPVRVYFTLPINFKLAK
jgi:protein TonB